MHEDVNLADEQHIHAPSQLTLPHEQHALLRLDDLRGAEDGAALRGAEAFEEGDRRLALDLWRGALVLGKEQRAYEDMRGPGSGARDYPEPDDEGEEELPPAPDAFLLLRTGGAKSYAGTAAHGTRGTASSRFRSPAAGSSGST